MNEAVTMERARELLRRASEQVAVTEANVARVEMFLKTAVALRDRADANLREAEEFVRLVADYERGV